LRQFKRPSYPVLATQRFRTISNLSQWFKGVRGTRPWAVFRARNRLEAYGAWVTLPSSGRPKTSS